MTEDQERLWQVVYQERAEFIESHFGQLPKDILKIMPLTGVWPGGGVFKLEAPKLDTGRWLYTTFGLSNPDMPTTVTTSHVSVESEQGNPVSHRATLAKKETVPSYPDRPGYGYEIMVVTDEPADWPLAFLQWAVEAELLHDIDILGRVEKYGGLTTEDIAVGNGACINVLISKALSPMPGAMPLANGEAKLLVATVITDDEMVWSMTHGREALLEQLVTSELGQVSQLNRQSLFKSISVAFESVESREAAALLTQKGLLRRVHVFPLALGGKDVDANIVYLPKAAALNKRAVDEKILTLAQEGKVDGLSVNLTHKEKSFIPSALLYEVSGEAGFQHTVEVW